MLFTVPTAGDPLSSTARWRRLWSPLVDIALKLNVVVVCAVFPSAQS
jgi:hypothetical protein